METGRVFISAGEASGDIVGAHLVNELRRRDSRIRVFGTGGPRMMRAGVAMTNDTSDIGVVGVTEVVRTLPSVASAYRHIWRSVNGTRPDVAVLIGNDVFNVILARWLKRQRIPTVAYFPPQVWLWRSLLRPIARSFDAIVTSFPEEYETYARAHSKADVRFVGHYLASELRRATEQERVDARKRLGLEAGARVVGLLPGSRRGEIATLAKVLFDASSQLAGRDADLRFALATTDTTDEPLRALLASHPMAGRIVRCRDSHSLMRSADLVLVASGTASLECALIGTPMIIVYKVSAITNVIALSAIRLGLIAKYQIGLPNLVLGSATVPELLQRRATAPLIATEAWSVLSSNARRLAMCEALALLRAQLEGPRPLAAAVDVVLEWAGQRPPDAASARSWLTPSRLVHHRAEREGGRVLGTMERE